MYRKEPLKTGEIYHVFTKSIAGFRVFNSDSDYSRIINAIRYYQRKDSNIKFSYFFAYAGKKNSSVSNLNNNPSSKNKLVEIIAYCIMPTHLHLILKQLKDKGISTFINNILNSYSRYFNIKTKRKGPLWESRFKSVSVKTDGQLLHLTRYIHLNPVTSYLTEEPQLWLASSYNEFTFKMDNEERICRFDDVLNINPESYRKFVDDRISYQRELKQIKDLMLE